MSDFMIIKNKIESINKINELGLNKFPEMLFKKNEDIEFNEYEEYSEEYEKIVFDSKEKKFRKILC